MRIKKKNIKRLASLSALGAGALAAGAGTASATIINTPLPTPVTVGPGSPGTAVIPLVAPGLVGNAALSLVLNSVVSGTSGIWSVFFRGVNLGSQGGFYDVNPTGFSYLKLFSAPIPSATVSGLLPNLGRVAERARISGSSYPLGNPSTPTPMWAMFRFQNGGSFLNGWVQLNNQISVNPGSGPTVTVDAWAYDVPEPSAFTLAGLGALALGAAGIRRWRAARKA